MVELVIEHLLREIDVDTKILEQGCRSSRVTPCGLDILRAAKVDQHAPVVMELVALRVTAEVVMIFNNENFRGRPCFFLKKVRGRKPADATANDDQIVFFTGVLGVIRIVPPRAIA